LGCLENTYIAAIVCSVNSRELYRVVGTFVCYLWGPEFDAWTRSLSSRPMFCRYSWHCDKEDHKLYLLLGLVMAEAVMCRPVTSEFWVLTQATKREICGGVQSGTATDISPSTSVFPPSFL
jgi:hypothetical protein